MYAYKEGNCKDSIFGPTSIVEIRRHADVSVGLIFGKDPTQSNKHKYRNSETVSVTDLYIAHRKIYHCDFFLSLMYVKVNKLCLYLINIVLNKVL